MFLALFSTDPNDERKSTNRDYYIMHIQDFFEPPLLPYDRSLLYLCHKIINPLPHICVTLFMNDPYCPNMSLALLNVLSSIQ